MSQETESERAEKGREEIAVKDNKREEIEVNSRFNQPNSQKANKIKPKQIEENSENQWESVKELEESDGTAGCSLGVERVCEASGCEWNLQLFFSVF